MANISMTDTRSDSRPVDDAELVESARNDPAALAALYQRYLTPVYRYLYHRVGNSADAEDLASQVFIEALEGLVRYQDRGNFAAWLFTIAYRKAITFYRRTHMDMPYLSQDFKETLLRFLDAPDPHLAFATRLEHRLLEHQAELLSQAAAQRPVPRSIRRRFPGIPLQLNWQLAVFGLLVVLTLVMLAIGPQRVLAQFQKWLGYVPGIGFVDLDQTRVLAGPVELTREGVVLRVEQVVAGPERTQILISSPGLKEDDLPWPNPALEHPDLDAHLQLPDGSLLEPQRWEMGIGTGTLEFPALPQGVYQVVLKLSRLPLVPPGALPENWEVPFTLRPATGELTAELFPQPYSPTAAGDTHHGITLRVLDVAQGPAETAVQWQVEWPDPQWELRFGLGSYAMPELHDDLGHVYWEKRGTSSSVAVAVVPAPAEAPHAPTPAPQLPNQTGTLVFPSLSLSANQLRLQVDGLEFQVPASAGFTIDLGPDPQVGDSWPLDLHMDIAGFPVHFTGARLRQETTRLPDGKSETQGLLEFDLDPLPEKGGLRLSSFDLYALDEGFNGSGSTGRLGSYKPHLNLSQVDQIPSGRIQVQVTGASLMVLGPWEVAWDVPRTAPVKAAPAVLQPQEAGQERSGVRLSVQEAFLSDWLAAIKLGAEGLPPGTAFIQPVSYDPQIYDPAHPKIGLLLEDNWGRRYDPGRNEVFFERARTEQGHDPAWLYFPPLQPLAQHITLHVPAVEVSLPGQAGFEVDVPGDLRFTPEHYPVTVIGGGGPERQEMETRWVSRHWAVDIPLEIAGYSLHFTEAWVERDEGFEAPYRLMLKGEPLVYRLGEQILNQLRFTAIARPDGSIRRPQDFTDYWRWDSQAYGVVGREEAGSTSLQAGIVLDVTATNVTDLLPGQYVIDLNGVTVYIPGPWELSWSLSNP